MLVARLYARRIININVNVIVAGVLAGALTVVAVYFTRPLGIHNKWAIAAIAVVADIVFDVAIYYALHWLANHAWDNPHGRRPGSPKLSFIKDATLVQFERALLGPLYYGVMVVTMKLAMNAYGIEREWATSIGVANGLLVTRLMHTLWMLRQEKRRTPHGAFPASTPPPPPPTID